MDAEDVRKSLESRRRAALENAREGMTDAVRDRVNAQVHALTLVLRDLGLESEDGRRLTPASPALDVLLESWEPVVDFLRRAVAAGPNGTPAGPMVTAGQARRAIAAFEAAKSFQAQKPALEPLLGAEIGDVEPQGECNAEVFAKGQSLVALDSRSAPAQAWVERVAQENCQRVDWHYSGGVAHVLVLGDHAKALEVAKRLAPALGGTVLRWFDADELGCYRAGVASVPDDVVAVDVVGSL